MLFFCIMSKAYNLSDDFRFAVPKVLGFDLRAVPLKMSLTLASRPLTIIQYTVKGISYRLNAVTVSYIVGPCRHYPDGRMCVERLAR